MTELIEFDADPSTGIVPVLLCDLILIFRILDPVLINISLLLEGLPGPDILAETAEFASDQDISRTFSHLQDQPHHQYSASSERT